MGAARGDEKWNVAPFRNANWLSRKPADRYTHFHARFRGLFIPPVVNVLVKREVETWRRHRRRQPRDNCLNAATNQPASFPPILLDVRNLTRYAKASWESRLLIVLGNERPSTVNPCHPSRNERWLEERETRECTSTNLEIVVRLSWLFIFYKCSKRVNFIRETVLSRSNKKSSDSFGIH